MVKQMIVKNVLMKKLVLILLLSTNVYASNITIVSDMDETIKRTHVSNLFAAGINALFTQKVWAGVPELLENMQSYTNDLFVLSNSPNIFRCNIKILLKKHDMDYRGLYTRHLKNDKDKFHYKYSHVVEHFDNDDTKLILMGDDHGEDPEIYAKVQSDFPGRVLAIYIRKNKNREIPAGSVPFVTVFDVAVNEYKSGRMDFISAVEHGVRLLDLNKFKKALPKWTFCPKTTDFWANVDAGELKPLFDRVNKRIVQHCNR